MSGACAGRVALVTGASQGGIGTAIAVRLAAEGAKVALTARSQKGLEETAARILGRGPSPNDEVILGFTTDDLPALLDRVRAAGGRVHAPIKELPQLGVRVAFATDPEGHLAELVQVVAPAARP